MIVIARGLPIVPVPKEIELERGIVVRVNEFPPIERVPGDHPPLPLNLADNPNDLVPSALCPIVMV